MGFVFKKTTTRSMPEHAEVFLRKGERYARWKPTRGRTRTARVTTGQDGTDRIRTESGTWTARYRDGDGRTVETSTGCRDRGAAETVLRDLERRAELVRSGVVSAREQAAADHQAVPISNHVDAYLVHLSTKVVRGHRVTEAHRINVQHNLERLFGDCRFRRLRDLDREAVERWLLAREGEGLSARTRNAYLAAAIAFANWCVRSNRLLTNPFAGVSKADELGDRRRERRALTEEEIVRLLDAAQRRPLLEAQTIRTGPRKGQLGAKVRPEVEAGLERTGRERSLLYKLMLLTGARKGEAAALRVGDLHLDTSPAWAELPAASEKARRGAKLPLRRDLAEDLERWGRGKLDRLQDEAGRSGSPIPARLHPDTAVFEVPSGLIRIFDRDLAFAGIPKIDDAGRTVDLHSLRHTFGTHLSRAGVAPRTAQAAMRHSSIDLTMNVYTDPQLLDVAGAVESLPALPLDAPEEKRALAAVGSAPGDVAPDVALNVAPTPVDRCLRQSSPDRPAGVDPHGRPLSPTAASDAPVTKKNPLSSAGRGRCAGAGDEDRTHDIQLGKLTLYH